MRGFTAIKNNCQRQNHCVNSRDRTNIQKLVHSLETCLPDELMEREDS